YALTLLSVLIPRRARPTLLPYTTLFRSEGGAAAHEAVVATRGLEREPVAQLPGHLVGMAAVDLPERLGAALAKSTQQRPRPPVGDRKSTRLNSSHVKISYAVFCLKKKKN